MIGAKPESPIEELQTEAAANAAAIGRLERLLAALDAKVDELMLADARRTGFWRGARFGAQLVLYGLAAALGGATGKLVEWLGSAFQPQ